MSLLSLFFREKKQSKMDEKVIKNRPKNSHKNQRKEKV